ncbi:serine hydrolase domain-containing protein [Viscerimonas tarda]
MKKILVALLLSLPFQVSSQNLYFPPVAGGEWETISPKSLNWNQSEIDSLYSYLEEAKTKSFILLKDGKIALEKYFGTHTQESTWYWASAGKSLTAFLVGIAQQEKFLSIKDATSKYLGQGWTSLRPGQEAKITIWNQLTMTTGLDDGPAIGYCTDDTCLTYKADPGTRWAYHNGPYTLLDSVIQKAAGATLTGFLQQKLQSKTGITGSYVLLGYNKVFFSTARSMARYGLLILNKGNWDGNQILTDIGYFNQMVNTSQPLNESYGYLWWLNGKATHRYPSTQRLFEGPLIPNAPADVIAALGANGQVINVAPGKNIVVIRMGEADGKKAGAPVSSSISDEIWKYINKF